MFTPFPCCDNERKVYSTSPCCNNTTLAIIPVLHVGGDGEENGSVILSFHGWPRERERERSWKGEVGIVVHFFPWCVGVVLLRRGDTVLYQPSVVELKWCRSTEEIQLHILISYEAEMVHVNGDWYVPVKRKEGERKVLCLPFVLSLPHLAVYVEQNRTESTGDREEEEVRGMEAADYYYY